METHAHQQLKRLALAFLRAQGCAARASEVRCPLCRYRVDAAGYCDIDPVLKRRLPARCIIVECKVSRSDFLRDRAQVQRLLRIREHLERVRESIQEHLIKIHEPHLRQVNSSLFAELDDWDFSRSRDPRYRRVLKRLQRVDEQLYGQTKFFLMAQYRLADRLYIAAPRGMIRRAELPRGWGLLECPPDALQPHTAARENAMTTALGPALFSEPPQLNIHHPAGELGANDRRRLTWLRNIAAAASLKAVC